MAWRIAWLVLGITAYVFAPVPAAADAFEQHLGTGRALYEQGKIEDAVDALKAAVALRPDNAMAHLWLGRALGRKAENANRLEAAVLAGEVRRELERAVALDPRNLDARSDLLEYYLDAPSTLGGGAEKADKEADAIARLDPVEGARAHARVAAKHSPGAGHEHHAAAR